METLRRGETEGRARQVTRRSGGRGIQAVIEWMQGAPTDLNASEPPDADPHIRWCDSGETAAPFPPMPTLCQRGGTTRRLPPNVGGFVGLVLRIRSHVAPDSPRGESEATWLRLSPWRERILENHVR